MPDQKIIAVIGATGAQGGGLVRAIAADKDGPFTARAITRNPASDKALALVKLGVEVVAGDADDAPSLDRAFAGAHGAFCVGCCWSLMLMMFAVGVGSLAWMFALGAIMAIEKNATWGRTLRPPVMRPW